ELGIYAEDTGITVLKSEVKGFQHGIALLQTGTVSGVGESLVDSVKVSGARRYGIYVDGVAGLVVENTIVTYASEAGIAVTNTQRAPSNLHFVNDLLFANGYGITGGAGLNIATPGTFEIVNSIVVSNNVGISCTAVCSAGYSDVWGNLTNFAGAATQATTGKKLDPRFKSAAEGDFSLLFDSPCVNGGLDSAAPNHDAVGTTRPLGAHADMGPYEFLSTPTSMTIAINEIMSNPVDEGRDEFIELYNFGATGIDVAGFIVDDGDERDTLVGRSGGATLIPAGGYAVIVDPDYAGFYGIPTSAVLLTVASSTTLGSGLSNADPVRLFMGDGVTPVDSFSFPFNAGNGISVEKDDIAGGDTGANWVASPCGSTPGAENCASLPPNVSTQVLIAINEVMANPLDEAKGEFIELYNFGATAIDLGGMLINDGDATDALAGWQGGGTLLQPGQFAVVLDPEYVAGAYTIPNGTLLLTVASTTTVGSGLATNDPISLHGTNGVVIDTYTHTFDAGNGFSVEKVNANIGDIASNFSKSTCASGSSPGAVNCITNDGVNPVAGATIAITEVMANPINEDAGEFIELMNYGNDPVDLAGFRIWDGDVEESLQAFNTGGNTVLASGAFAVILDAEYTGQYNVPAGTVLLTTPDTSIGSGLSTDDPMRLRAKTGAKAIDTYLFPFNPGNGVSSEKIDLVVGDVPANWIASSCNQSAGLKNCSDGGAGGGNAPISATQITLSEVMANPLDESQGEYIELFNAGPVGVNVAGWWIGDGDSLDQISAWSTGGTVLMPGDFGVIFDPDYANNYTVVAGTIRLKVGNTSIGNGLSTDDPITLYEADATTVVDSFSFPYNPGNGYSVEKVTLTSGDTQANWVTSTCKASAGDRNDGASPGGRNCADPYGGLSGTNALGQQCPFGAADCISGLCAIELTTNSTFCTADCSQVACTTGFTCTDITDVNYPQVCVPVGGGAVPTVTINEVLFDSVGTDTEVFIELKGTPNAILDGLSLVGINGSNGTAYVTLPLTGQIAADGYFVIAAVGATGAIAAAADLLDDKVNLQNGPDSIQLRWGTDLVDAVGYGDFSAAVFGGEGTPAPATAPGESLARTPNGADTGDNNADFAIAATPTPGAAN
ncbi:MAG: hypothetical protein COW42_08665, partial [Deltaproteobacteria bacterium CG17_big_fil_post_rev_8_21_14_2_50_63_7]